jgi:hypothetical protein
MLPLNVKKMITREVELQQMRRSETSASAKGSKGGAGAKKLDTAQGDSRTTEAAVFVLPELSGKWIRSTSLRRLLILMRTLLLCVCRGENG